MKSTLLLATALFLISAPAPDGNDVAEMTSNFIVPKNEPGLMAAESTTKNSVPDQSADVQTAKIETYPLQADVSGNSADDNVVVDHQPPNN